MSTTSFRQQVICLIVAIGGLLFGFDTAVISGALLPLKQQFALDAVMEGWLVSSGLIGCIIGVLITGVLSDRIGRKKTIIIAAWMFLLSAIGCTWAPGISVLVFSRMIGGIGVGMASVISPMYITEFAPAKKRGQMVAYYQLAITVGIVLAYASNAGLAGIETSLFPVTEMWRPMFLVMAIPSIAFLLLLIKVPESPRWLMKTGQSQKAAQVLQSVRTQEEVEQELYGITQAAIKAEHKNISLLSPAIRVPLIIGVVLAVFQQFSGINAIIYYGPGIFEAAGFDSSNALLFQVVIGSVNVLSTFIAIRLVDKYGRKSLLKAGLIGIVLSLVLCGLLFYTGQTKSPFLLVLMLFYIACFAFSLGPVTWIIINEIFPTEIRVKAVAFCTLMLWVAVWAVGQFVPWLLATAGPAVLFWIFALFSGVNFFFSWKVVKETKGKSLEEMEDVFMAPH
jgi:SP family arabinose:H+ symporter-like MFS transporter